MNFFKNLFYDKVAFENVLFFNELSWIAEVLKIKSELSKWNGYQLSDWFIWKNNWSKNAIYTIDINFAFCNYSLRRQSGAKLSKCPVTWSVTLTP